MYRIEDCLYRERWGCTKDIPGVHFLPTHDFSMSSPKPSIVVTNGGDFGVEYDENDFFHWKIKTTEHTNKEVSSLDSSVLKWFTTNCNNLREECEMLPLGVVDESCMKLINKNLHNPKTKPLYCNFQTYSNKKNREEVLRQCKTLEFCTIEQNLSNQDYYKSLSEHSFVICPTGNGIDSYRVWEGLYLRTIPILQHSDFAIRLQREFPIMIVDSYAELTTRKLEDFLETVNFEYTEKLYKDYWINKIKDYTRLTKKTYIDVGANYGHETFKFMREPDTYVYSIEPNPELYDKLKNDTLNKNVSVFNFALSNYNGKARFNLSNKRDKGCSSLNSYSKNSKTEWPGRDDFIVDDIIEVEVKTLKNFIKEQEIQKIDFIKIDAQGEDLRILEGCSEHLNKIKSGVIEACNKTDILYNNQNSKEASVKFLENNGFMVERIEPNDPFDNEVNIFFRRKDLL